MHLSEPLFTAAEVWLGGYYELALEVGEGSDHRLLAVQIALWSHPALTGCFLDSEREPNAQPRLSAADGSLEAGTHLLGIALLPNGARVSCGSCLVREEGGSDWLVFYLPMGSLDKAYPVGGYPFDSDRNPPGAWQRQVDDWLAQVGLHAAASAPFRLGLLGFEVSGQVYARDVAVEGVPPRRHVGYLWPSNGVYAYHPRSA